MKKLSERYSETLGECLHTALRKGCDSKATSIAHTMIKLSNGALWNLYLETVKDQIVQIDNIKDLPKILKEVSTELFEDAYLKAQHKDKSLEENWDYFWVLKYSFDLFSDSDWEGYVSYLKEGYSSKGK